MGKRRAKDKAEETEEHGLVTDCRGDLIAEWKPVACDRCNGTGSRVPGLKCAKCGGAGKVYS